MNSYIICSTETGELYPVRAHNWQEACVSFIKATKEAPPVDIYTPRETEKYRRFKQDEPILDLILGTGLERETLKEFSALFDEYETFKLVYAENIEDACEKLKLYCELVGYKPKFTVYEKVKDVHIIPVKHASPPENDEDDEDDFFFDEDDDDE